jgi:electron transfer flavoprotein alpha subunit
MDSLKINQQKVTSQNAEQLVKLCPFNAIEYDDGRLDINAACKMCKICVKKGPDGVIELVKGKDKKIDKSKWKNIAVYVDHSKADIHPVTFELIGKALELAKKVKYEVYCVFLGHGIKEKANELLYYGVDKVFVCDYKELEDFKIEPYTAAFENFIKK